MTNFGVRILLGSARLRLISTRRNAFNIAEDFAADQNFSRLDNRSFVAFFAND